MAKRAKLRLVSDSAENAYSHRDAPARERGRRRQNIQPCRNAEDTYEHSMRPKSVAQAEFVEAIESNDIVLALGPAGSGKTYISVRKAVEALRKGRVNRIVLARPAVEAGERLGFLPGDEKEKVAPYLRPVYDILMTCLPHQKMQAMMAQGIIEVVPVGFMRGRNLDKCAVIIDEAQNLTKAQLKMILTRIGHGSFMVLSGDPRQSDLEPGMSGLEEIAARLDGKAEGIAVVRLDETDIVRHPVIKVLLPLLEAA